MSIIFDKDKGVITLNTKNTTYQMARGRYGHLLHTYYGGRCEGDMSYLLNYVDRGYSPNPHEAGHDRTYSLDLLPLEYSAFGSGDFRSPSLIAENGEGASAADLRIKDIRILEGIKYSIPGMPSSYANEGDRVDTLMVALEDELIGLRAELFYGVFEDTDVIARAVCLINKGRDIITIDKAASLVLDMPQDDYGIVHFRGRYGKERLKEETALMHGSVVLSSRRGISSHQENPFFILTRGTVTETSGECCGVSLVYSGDFKNEIEKCPYNSVRIVSGISDEQFSLSLLPGDDFWTPEAIMSFSESGFETLSDQFHRHIRKNICRGPYKESRRPVLINNWEATYFDFTGEKLKAIAKRAGELGVELFVLDDGWFGKRESDTTGLGDWYVNEDKLQGTLRDVADTIRSYGMKFGLWFEPEMISEDSDLFREHPDYAFAIPGRAPVRGRHQLLLDFSRKEVVDNIFAQMSKVLDETGVDYLKLDMNRSISEVYTRAGNTQNRGVVLHRYVLGVYDLLQRLLDRYPDIMIEGCCGGGGRVDPGMLYYVPQIWCSDNTDAIERLEIQYGTSFGYPMSTVGAHVSIVPNHQTGRVTPIETRGTVALAGGFGFELDLNLLTEEETEKVRVLINNYKHDWKLIQQGRYYRLTEPGKGRMYMAWEYAEENAEEVLVGIVNVSTQYNQPPEYIRLRGLIENAEYICDETGKTYGGAALMRGGISIPDFRSGEYSSLLMRFRKK